MASGSMIVRQQESKHCIAGRMETKTCVSFNAEGTVVANLSNECLLEDIQRVPTAISLDRLFSRNHLAKVKVMELIQRAAAGNANSADALEKLQQLMKSVDPAVKKCVTKAFASAMGGAPYIAEGLRQGKWGFDMENLSKNAIKTFLKLSDPRIQTNQELGDASFSHDDCIEVRKQLKSNDVFRNSGSLFWTGVQVLELSEREALGDTFGNYPRKVYIENREMQETDSRIANFRKNLSDIEKESDLFAALRDNLSFFGVILLKGDVVPSPEVVEQLKAPEQTDDEILRNFPRDMERTPENEVQFISKCQENRRRFEENKRAELKKILEPLNKISDLTPEEQDFRTAMRKFQSLREDFHDIEEQIKRATSLIRKYPPNSDYNLQNQNKPNVMEEFSSRQDLLAGCPGASFEKAFDVVARQCREMNCDSWRSWNTALAEYEQQLAAIESSTEQLPEDGAALLQNAQMLQKLHEQYTWVTQREYALNHNPFLAKIGGLPEEYGTPYRDPNNLFNKNMQRLLQQAAVLLLGIDGERFQGKELQDVIQIVNERLREVELSIDPTSREQIQEMLKIADEVKIAT
jgi:hypothetical protein